MLLDTCLLVPVPLNTGVTPPGQAGAVGRGRGVCFWVWGIFVCLFLKLRGSWQRAFLFLTQIHFNV